ncbi:hypothetical protein PoB_000392100 [Plakobranchus ocellatus]|uniref:Uncharacterized protein n=1 Tax=Plakobranchus ocellatus TaxID=259542 RepID=A0AAV3Y2M4_9GAST|nr:hypothetical protein PoB_000392100 [Plakobranchus ocellatus]
MNFLSAVEQLVVPRWLPVSGGQVGKCAYQTVWPYIDGVAGRTVACASVSTRKCRPELLCLTKICESRGPVDADVTDGPP